VTSDLGATPVSQRTVDASDPTRSGGGRRRRPSGAPPPLPRSIGATGKVWLAIMGVLLVVVANASAFDDVGRAIGHVDAAILRGSAELRTGWLTSLMRGVERVLSSWGMTSLGIGLLVAVVAFKRWRHLFTLLGSLLAVQVIGELFYEGLARPRPFDVTILGSWGGYSFPSPPVVILTFVVVSIIYTLVPAGRPRTVAKAVALVPVGLLVAAELYLASYHPTDMIFGLALTMAITVNAYRVFTPNEVFPVVYRRGKSAHLDIGGRRGQAIRRAVEAQLGVTVTDLDYVGLAGSGGSTPLLLTVEGDSDRPLFGKLYAMSHVRADRWYKLGRTLLYGRLEDETPFQSVRRLVEYEDYRLRLLQDVGIRCPEPYGIVELTPEREYLLVTEFVAGAAEIGDATVDDAVIDEGLALIRALWDAGIAHRDIKPANLLVRDGHVVLIDPAFMQIRPSPWRQAVDLANMMLVLAVRTDADRVYRRALQFFTEDDIAEAFAAARGVASPSQLRSVMKHDGRDLLAQFRRLAPPRRAISLQRFSVKRVLLAAAVVFGLVVVTPAILSMFRPAHDIGVTGTPECGTGAIPILMAQSVPSATSVPCVASVPSGWHLGDVHVRDDESSFWLDADEAGGRAVEVTLRPPGGCDVTDATAVASDEVGMRRFEQVEDLPPDLRSSRTYEFEGGCVTYDFDFDTGASSAELFAADGALAFQPRDELVARVRERTGLRLCGAGVACPGGS
jgi:tRNA A-37 threonylcarbamoyl transferase component Bud32